jgi:hypothetical protein
MGPLWQRWPQVLSLLPFSPVLPGRALTKSALGSEKGTK